jgi:hypothetical protein
MIQSAWEARHTRNPIEDIIHPGLPSGHALLRLPSSVLLPTSLSTFWLWLWPAALAVAMQKKKERLSRPLYVPGLIRV